MLKKNSDSKSLILTKIEYYNLIEELRVAASAKNKSNRQYYILGRYEVLQCGGVEKLIKKRKDETQELVYFVHVEDLFGTIKRAHIATGHGGRDKMVKELSRYANVTRDTVELFKSLCVQCQKKRKRCTTKVLLNLLYQLGLWLTTSGESLLTYSLVPKENISG